MAGGLDGTGRLTAVDPRVVWPREAQDFTPWLLEHADSLADVLGIDLELTANEHPVGGFAQDLIGKDVTNGCVLIVENQLTVTNHVHLGQLLTYAAGTDTATIVWIAMSFREEHRQAVDWLNSLEGEDARFFGIEIGAVRVGESPASAASHAHGCFAGGQRELSGGHVGHLYSRRERHDAMAAVSPRCMPGALAVELQFCSLTNLCCWCREPKGEPTQAAAQRREAISADGYPS